MSFRIGASFIAGAGSCAIGTTLWNHYQADQKKGENPKERIVFLHTDKGFVYSGTTPSQVTSPAKEELEKGKFVSCSYKLPHQSPLGGKSRYLKVIIAGKTDAKTCEAFHMLYKALEEKI